MQPDVVEWISKAEADWETAQREFRVRRKPNFDAVCFHAQQCVEKYLKARLIISAIKFPKTHDRVALLALVQEAEPLWEPWKEHLATLTHYAVTVRYPGESAERADAAKVLKLAKLLRTGMRGSFGLTTKPTRRKK